MLMGTKWLRLCAVEPCYPIEDQKVMHMRSEALHSHGELKGYEHAQ